MAYRIYLVDDDRFLLDLYAVKFKNAGHEVTAFGSGEELLDSLYLVIFWWCFVVQVPPGSQSVHTLNATDKRLAERKTPCLHGSVVPAAIMGSETWVRVQEADDVTVLFFLLNHSVCIKYNLGRTAARHVNHSGVP